MQYTERIDWKQVSLDNVNRGQSPQQMVDALIRDPKNTRFVARLQAQLPASVRKTICNMMSWTRKNRRYAKLTNSTPSTPVQVEKTNKLVTFMVGGTPITVVAGTPIIQVK